jgi:hypothetical protein
MAKDIIQVNNHVYERRDKNPLVIAIVDNRGLTFVGRFSGVEDELGLSRIENARCVVRWGTDAHLGQLADTGPRENTMLGYAKDVYFRRENLVALYFCDEVAWEAGLKEYAERVANEDESENDDDD